MLCTGREISFFADGARVAIDLDIIYDPNGGRAFAHNLKLLGPTAKSITGPNLPSAVYNTVASCTFQAAMMVILT